MFNFRYTDTFCVNTAVYMLQKNVSNDATNSITGTMGIISSRAVLFFDSQSRESKVYPKRHIKTIVAPNRLVCDKLCKKVQCSLPYKESKTRHSVSVIQIPSESLQ